VTSADRKAITPPDQTFALHIVRTIEELPSSLDRAKLARFLHETMRPYEDEIPDVERALDYAFSSAEGKGGYIVLAMDDDGLVGVVVMLNTGMAGYIPETVLVFVAVSPKRRNQGIGAWIIREAVSRAPRAVKLHVEYDNPAKRLYERLGFTNKYAEMRLAKGALQ